MSQNDSSPGKEKRQYTANLALAAVAGQVGLLTSVIVIGALLLGLWIDSRLDTRPTYTIVLIVASVPVTLVAMFWIVRNVTKRIKTGPMPSTDDDNEQEESLRGRS
jgi:F0F1-type ATP synthase assembly protein I